MAKQDNNKHIYCRICGSYELNRSTLNVKSASRIELNELLNRGGSLDVLIRPCECRGEFTYTHRLCLENWIETTQHRFCDICRFQYNAKFVKCSIFDWFERTNTTKNIVKVLAIAIIVYYVSSLGILECQRVHIRGIHYTFVLTSSYLWILLCSLFLIMYSVNLFKEYKCWRETNQKVLVEPNNDPQLESEPKPKDILRTSGFKVKSHI